MLKQSDVLISAKTCNILNEGGKWRMKCVDNGSPLLSAYPAIRKVFFSSASRCLHVTFRLRFL